MAIAEAELGEISKRLHDAGAATQPSPPPGPSRRRA